MKNTTTTILLIFSFILGSVLINACDDGYRINTKKLIEEEKTLMEHFVLEQHDSIASKSDSIFDVLEQDGMVYFETEEGTGDSVKVGQQVGFRYTVYVVDRDSLDVPQLYYSGDSNFGASEPWVYTAGNNSVYNGGVYPGLDAAIQRMAYGTRARIYVLSSLWASGGRPDYTPRVVDIEVTYLEK